MQLSALGARQQLHIFKVSALGARQTLHIFWRFLPWVMVSPSLLFLALAWVLPESPAWLIEKGAIFQKCKSV
jgi:hypothetical protein